SGSTSPRAASACWADNRRARLLRAYTARRAGCLEWRIEGVFAMASKSASSSRTAATSAPAPRVLWKGAISFGLVHIPVALYSATRDSGIDFDWLDKRSMDPVGYKRINKKTGKEIAREHIVRGVQYESGQYVVLSDKEI